MRKILFAAITFVAASLPSVTFSAPQSYAFDKAHTNILFAISHLGMSEFYGQFNEFDGKVVFDPEDPAQSSVEVTIKTPSIDTDVAALDEHLQAPDFFDAAKYPTIVFKSKRVNKVSRDTFRIVGDLTMRGQTRTATLSARLNHLGEHPLSKFNEKYKDAYYAAFSATTTILRSDFGMDLYAPTLSDQVRLIIEVELKRQ